MPLGLAAEASETAHRAMLAADGTAMDSPDAGVSPVRRIHPPRIEDLRRVYPRRNPSSILGPHTRARTAHHEAGHIVLFEWVGLRPTAAEINHQGGTASFCPESVGTGSDRSDPDGKVSAMAASVLHAGLAAELLFEGIDPSRVLYLRDDDDTEKAGVFLSDHFGPHCTGAHWYAQRFAMHLLSESWPRVSEIANHLLEHGTWKPKPTDY
jgi:hypothetical protein